MQKVNYSEVVRYIAKEFSDHGIPYGEKPNLSFDSQEDFDSNLENALSVRLKGGVLQGDDLDMIEVIMSVEDHYNIEIDDGWLGERNDNPTIGELVDLVMSLTK